MEVTEEMKQTFLNAYSNNPANAQKGVVALEGMGLKGLEIVKVVVKSLKLDLYETLNLIEFPDYLGND